ncbi:MAG: (Fe-S)-binding protein [Steroidobacteraceae bacterium]
MAVDRRQRDLGDDPKKVALFIPCYVDAVFPEVGVATLERLERLGVEVVYPLGQTCCGQPMANSGQNQPWQGTPIVRDRRAARRLHVPLSRR